LYELLDGLKNGRNKLEDVQEEIITMMSCRSSIKAGDVVTVPEIQKLIDELANCKLPYTCPHGRSIMIKVTVDELEKKFKRK
jgi:DNA mismatch repair protein MutL